MSIAEADTEIQLIKQRFGIVGHSRLLNNAVRVASQVATTDMSVLITGESGSGKEAFPKIIHHLSSRKHNPFIAINCGAIPEGTIDSELFGHVKGSFTGAHEARKGYFEVTDGGTLFLDEIGEMPPGTQARLLRVLENGEFISVGSSKVKKTNVRVVAATNVDLVKNVEAKKFREDLYYRLSTVPIYIPPLRERGSDIELLFRKFASDFSERYKVKPITLTEDAKKALLQYRFPGNIRQLKNLTEQMSVLATENREIDLYIFQKYLPKKNLLPTLYQGSLKEESSKKEIVYKILFEMRKDINELKKIVLENITNPLEADQIIKKHTNLFSSAQENKNMRSEHYTDDEYPMQIVNPSEIMKESVQDISHSTKDESLSIEKKERELIIKALHKNKNKRKYAAHDLGISERTLYRKIKEYGLETK